MRSHRREQVSVEARHAAYWLARTLTEKSLSQIGLAMGGRDTSTICQGVAAFERRLAEDPALVEKAVTARNMLEVLRRNRLLPTVGDPDAPLAADRVLRSADPYRAAGLVSTLEIVAMCGRLLALEEVAGGAYALLARIDRLGDANEGDDTTALRTDIRALADGLVIQLAELGYANEEAEPQQESINVHAAN